MNMLSKPILCDSQNVTTKGFQERAKALLWLTNAPLGPLLNAAL